MAQQVPNKRVVVGCNVEQVPVVDTPSCRSSRVKQHLTLGPRSIYSKPEDQFALSMPPLKSLPYQLPDSCNGRANGRRCHYCLPVDHESDSSQHGL